MLIENITELMGLKKTNKKARKHLKNTLKNLKEKEKYLKQKLITETDLEKCKELKRKVNILHTQRKKGLSLLKEMRNKP